MYREAVSLYRDEEVSPYLEEVITDTLQFMSLITPGLQGLKPGGACVGITSRGWAVPGAGPITIPGTRASKEWHPVTWKRVSLSFNTISANTLRVYSVESTPWWITLQTMVVVPSTSGSMGNYMHKELFLYLMFCCQINLLLTWCGPVQCGVWF